MAAAVFIFAGMAWILVPSRSDEAYIALDLLAFAGLAVACIRLEAPSWAKALGVAGAGFVLIAHSLQVLGAGTALPVILFRMAGFLIGAWVVGRALAGPTSLRVLGFLAAGVYSVGPLLNMILGGVPHLWIAWDLALGGWLVLTALRQAPSSRP